MQLETLMWIKRLELSRARAAMSRGESIESAAAWAHSFAAELARSLTNQELIDEGPADPPAELEAPADPKPAGDQLSLI